jgi:hypothetical protein
MKNGNTKKFKEMIKMLEGWLYDKVKEFVYEFAYNEFIKIKWSGLSQMLITVRGTEFLIVVDAIKDIVFYDTCRDACIIFFPVNENIMHTIYFDYENGTVKYTI